MPGSKRVLSIDVMRGITLFLMLFVNDLYIPGVPDWLTHRPADYDGMGLADWVFPGFLFMVGMAVPYSIQSRTEKGESVGKILLHILIRTLSLLFIGILMLNSGRVNPELTGMSKHLWSILMYVSVFFIWNRYPSGLSMNTLGFKLPAVLCLLFLLFRFKAGTESNPDWLETGWWGILGLIGWGYLVTSLVYLVVRDNLTITAVIWMVFFFLNVYTQIAYPEILRLLKPLFGIIIEGNVPMVVIAGLITGVLLKKQEQNPERFVLVSGLLGASAVLLGFFLRNWFIISKIKATPSWGMLCIGISIGVFMALYTVIDWWGKNRWTGLFQQAGRNSLTTYLLPSLLYYSIWYINLPLFFYKQTVSTFQAVSGSVIWAFLMLVLAINLSSKKVQLKL